MGEPGGISVGNMIAGMACSVK
ncbi:Protein of unknown function [Bacillus mycoides]|nr:Protein of unknown function [Bacillus mycoides]